ncbi:MAG: hypothetical protein SGILL_002758 [Bacillariaceae sp.]
MPPTKSPTKDDKPTPSDDDDDEVGGGKGSDGKGSSSGKGAGGSSHEDDDDDEYMPGKGSDGKGASSGKGSSGGDDDDTDDYFMSMSFSMPGKGAVPGKGGRTSKSSKSKKSSKSSKSSKGKGKGGGTGDDDKVPPSRSCEFPDDEDDSIEVRTMPYEVHYFPAESTPTTQDYDSLADVTDDYLEAFMRQEFDRTSLTNLNAFVTCLGRNEFESGNRIRVGYRSYGFFDRDSIFLPTERELDQLVRDAFEGENGEEYIRILRRDLADGNPFSDTEDIEFNEASIGWDDDRWDTDDRWEDNTRSSESSSIVRAGVAAGAAGIVVLAAGLAIMRSRSRHAASEAEEDAFPRHKNLHEDSATVAEETCNMSVDGTMASWKSPRGFQTTSSEDEGEFQDEPLDE